MDYESLETLDELLGDSSAAEFREVLPDIPAGKLSDGFYQWVDKDGPDNWGQEYHSMFLALGRLVRAENSYDIAMSSIKTLQKKLRPTVTPAEPVIDEPPPPPPEEAAREAAVVIGPAIIEKLLQEHPEFVADIPAEELSKIAMEAMGQAIDKAIS